VSELPDIENRARELLVAAGLNPTEEEMRLFESMYPILRARADRVYTVATGYEA
jgi:hypothetical protein